MIKIQKYIDVEPEFFKARSFGDSNEVVTSVLEEVQKRGDAALRLYGQKFDVAVPAVFEIPQEELKAAAEKLKIEKRDVYDAIVYSHDLALRFATKQKNSFIDFEEELEPGLFTGQKTLPVDRAGCYVPAGRFPQENQRPRASERQKTRRAPCPRACTSPKPGRSQTSASTRLCACRRPFCGVPRPPPRRPLQPV